MVNTRQNKHCSMLVDTTPNSKLAKEHYSTDIDYYCSIVKKAIESI